MDNPCLRAKRRKLTRECILRLVEFGFLTRSGAVLLVLHTSETQGLQASELAEELNISRSLVSMTVTKLAKLGLVEQRFPVRDQRTVNIYLTLAGITKASYALSLFEDAKL